MNQRDKRKIRKLIEYRIKNLETELGSISNKMEELAIELEDLVEARDLLIQ